MNHDLKGKTVLVVEDEMLLALDYETQLQEAGARVLGPAPREAKALDLLAHERPDAAVVDLNLHGDQPAELARMLVERQVPFVVVTGYGDRLFSEPALQAAPRLHKPVQAADLVRQLRQAVDRMPNNA